MTQSLSVGRRIFVRSFKMPGVWLEWFITPTNPPTFSGYWVMDEHGFLVEASPYGSAY